jgi:hypothetical protein
LSAREIVVFSENIEEREEDPHPKGKTIPQQQKREALK